MKRGGPTSSWNILDPRDHTFHLMTGNQESDCFPQWAQEKTRHSRLYSILLDRMLLGQLEHASPFELQTSRLGNCYGLNVFLNHFYV